MNLFCFVGDVLYWRSYQAVNSSFLSSDGLPVITSVPLSKKAYSAMLGIGGIGYFGSAPLQISHMGFCNFDIRGEW
jgi:hypothetical protein